ncbi:MAG: hypothetical protein JO189_06815 [Deltaproteobacteria bacterium]|nr:hypothetical protein [Deltaproteobacteria bacterium]
MKHRLLLLFLCAAAALSVIASPASSQEQVQRPSSIPKLRGYFTVKKPTQSIDIDTIRSAAATTATLPLWSFDALSSRDGHHYEGVIVGRDPFNNPGSVSVPTIVVPLIIKTNTVAVSVNPTTRIITTAPGVTIFNPAVADTACLKAPNNVPTKLFAESPIFKPATFNFGGTIVGTTQYSDAFQRGNFWNALGSNVDVYHVLLGPVKFLAPIVLNAPAIYGTVLPSKLTGACGPLGIVDINWFDALLTGSIIPSLAAKGVNPASFPIFLVHNVVWAAPVTNYNTCCAIGYHSITGFPLPLQTYSPQDFDSTGMFSPISDADTASHEVGEWMDDPYIINEVTPWGNVGQVRGCTAILEVGDPLSGTEYPPIVMPNGFTYHLQELAFFSWFFGPPSIGIHRWFSDNGTFLTDAGPPCH